MNEVLATFTNTDDGTEARVVAFYKGGFSVALFDTDANAAVGAKVFPTFEAAEAYAKGLVA